MDDLYKTFVLAQALGSSGGSSVTVEELSVTANGTYTADEGKAYSPVTVNVGGAGETVTFTVPSYMFYGGEVNSLTYTDAGGVRRTINYGEDCPKTGIDVLKGSPLVWSMHDLATAGYTATITPATALYVEGSSGDYMIAMDANTTLTINSPE